MCFSIISYTFSEIHESTIIITQFRQKNKTAFEKRKTSKPIKSETVKEVSFVVLFLYFLQYQTYCGKYVLTDYSHFWHRCPSFASDQQTSPTKCPSLSHSGCPQTNISFCISFSSCSPMLLPLNMEPQRNLQLLPFITPCTQPVLHMDSRSPNPCLFFHF